MTPTGVARAPARSPSTPRSRRRRTPTPDVVALHRSGLDLDIALAATTASDLPDEVLGGPVDGGLAWPVNGVADDGTLDVLRAAGARVVVLSAAAFPPSPAVTYTPSGSVDLAGGGSPLRAAARRPHGVAPRRRPAQGRRALPGRRRRTPADRDRRDRDDHAGAAHHSPHARRRPGPLVAGRLAPRRATWSRPSTARGRCPSRSPSSSRSPASDVPRARVDYPASAQAAELSPSYLAAVQARARRPRRAALGGARRRHLGHRRPRDRAHPRRVRGLAPRPRRGPRAARQRHHHDRRRDRRRAGALPSTGLAARRVRRHPGDRRQRPRPPGPGRAAPHRHAPACGSRPTTSSRSRSPPARSRPSRCSRRCWAPGR